MDLEPIPPADFGTADYVSEITTVKAAEWGGFVALQVATPDGQSSPVATLLVTARQWSGIQPRLVLYHGQPGYADWRKLLDDAPEQLRTMRFVGSARASRSGFDQWLTHGPSALL